MNNIIIDTALLIHTLTQPIIFFIVFTIIVIFILTTKKHENALLLCSSLAVTGILVTILKSIFKIERPENAILLLNDYAFPSGHAALGFCLTTAVSIIAIRNLEKRWQEASVITFFLLISICISYSRIVLGLHTYIQIIAGAVIGILIPSVIFYILNKKKTRKK